jgi:cytochrome c biogenesis protein CcdA
MKLKIKEILIIYVIAILAFPSLSMSNPSVLIEFLYYSVCQDCPGLQIYYEVYMHNSQIVDNIQRDYGNNVLIKRIDWYSQEGQEKRAFYNLTRMDWNTIVINEEIILKGGDQFVNETYLRSIIDSYLALEHDIAILDVSINPRSLSKGEILNMTITVTNSGKQSESFNITIYFNNTSLETLLRNFLEPNASKTLTFDLNTTDFPEGYYDIIVYANPVQNELNIADNLYCAGIVEIKAQNTVSTIIHDLAVVSVIPSKSIIKSHEQISVTVTVKNLGTVAEIFTLKIFLNESLIKEINSMSLNPEQSISESFILDSFNLSAGNYVIKACIEPIESELKKENNEFSCMINILQSSDKMFDYTINISLAFIFGFLETFSPCLVILLSFVLSYTIGKGTSFKEGFFYVMIFGIGFVSAALIISLITILIFFSVSFQTILIWAACIFAILFGLNTIGLDIIRFFKVKGETKVLVQKLAKKYVKTYTGIVILGFLFYFLDPCVAPLFFAMAPLTLNVDFTLIVISFCLGVMLPFVGIGIIAGSISKLARNMYKHKFKLRVMSGLILICYSMYIIIFHLVY